MGGAASFKPIFNITFPFFLITITTTLTLIGPFIAAEADDDSRETPPIPSLEGNNGANTAAAAPQPPTDASTRNSGHFRRRSEPFKPSSAIVVGALTTMFSLTLILLLYIKYCNGGDIYIDGDNRGTLHSDERKNSGIDPAVVERLPIFRFRSLRGQKEGLDCAVCLMRFEDHEVLRLLPKCKHAFHVECVDKWLDQHSTCPLCRYKVDLKDIVTRQKDNESEEEKEEEEEEEPFDIENGTRRVPGRHSSVTGENDGGQLEIVLQDSNDHKTLTKSSSRSKSLDNNTSIITSRGGTVRPMRENNNDKRDNLQHRLEHRIFIDPPSSSSVNSNGSGSDGGSDLLYITSEMIIHDDGSVSRRRRRLRNSVQAPPSQLSTQGARRTVSEIAGLGRFLSVGRSRNGGREGRRDNRGERERRHREGVFTRWSAWISRLRGLRSNNGG